MKSLLAILLALSLSACETLNSPQTESPQQTATVIPPTLPTSPPPAPQPVHLSDYWGPYQTPASAEVDNWLPATYYATVRTSSEIPSAIQNCSEPSKLLKGLRKAFGIDSAEEILITANISSNGKQLAKNAPVLLVGFYDNPAPGGTPNCITKPFDGNLTPRFLFDASFNLKVEYEVSYGKNADINIANRIIELATSVPTLASGEFVANITQYATKPVLNILDDSLSAAFSQTATDYISAIFSSQTSPGSPRYDGYRLKLGELLPSDLGFPSSTQISTELVYTKSVLAIPNGSGSKWIYYKNPSRILALKSGISKNTLSDLLGKGDVPNVNLESLASYDESSDANLVGSACLSIKRYLTEKLGLSDDDQKVALWAVLKNHSQYNINQSIRSHLCFSPEELVDLSVLNGSFVFIADSYFQDREQKQLVSKTLSDLALGISTGVFRDTIDKENFELAIDPLELVGVDHAMQFDANAQANTNFHLSGESAVQFYQGAFLGIRCGRLANEKNIAFLFQLRRSVGNREFVPAFLLFDDSGKQVQTIVVRSKDSLVGTLNGLASWPEDINQSHCQNLTYL